MSSVDRVRCVFVGNQGVGKTSFIHRAAYDHYPFDPMQPYYDISKRIQIDSNDVYFEFEDTFGSADYDKLRPLIYPVATVCLLCFSLGDRDSFESVRHKWAPEVYGTTPKLQTILVGMKQDLRSDGGGIKDITYQEGCNMAKAVKSLMYLECSSKTNSGLNEVISAAIDIRMGKIQSKRECVIV